MLDLRFVFAAFLATLALCPPASTQCPVPDQLDGGPCCTVATPRIPGFTRFAQDALEICWRDCDVDAVLPYRATWRPLKATTTTGAPCGERWVTLELRTPGGPLAWTGDLRLQYSRTWLETDPAGLQLQVWRFLVNGDLQPTGALALPCPMPPCLPAFGNLARFTGYIDYARASFHDQKAFDRVYALFPPLAEKRMNAEAETSPTVRIWWKSVPALHKDGPALDILADEDAPRARPGVGRDR